MRSRPRLIGRWAYEIIYVNDGSTDDTADRLAALMRATRRICVSCATISRADSRRPCGSGGARRAAPSSRRWMVTGRTTRRSLPKLIEAIMASERIGLIAGQRLGRKDTGFKRMQSRIANKVRDAVLRGRHAGYRLRIEGIPARRVSCRCHISMACIVSCRRWCAAKATEIGYVDVVDRPRLSGVSNYGMLRIACGSASWT